MVFDCFQLVGIFTEGLLKRYLLYCYDVLVCIASALPTGRYGLIGKSEGMMGEV